MKLQAAFNTTSENHRVLRLTTIVKMITARKHCYASQIVDYGSNIYNVNEQVVRNKINRIDTMLVVKSNGQIFRMVGFLFDFYKGICGNLLVESIICKVHILFYAQLL